MNEVDAGRDRATPASVRHDDDEEEEGKGLRIDKLILLPRKFLYNVCVFLCVCVCVCACTEVGHPREGTRLSVCCEPQ
jgi:hypothetical protein